jgi:NAD(P)-dependent dehydrogenase (short-subunit alcohol dehydrogenase family)
MDNFHGKIAVITGGGTGMGRALARQLASEGCHIAMCDVSTENMAETKRLCAEQMPEGTRITTHEADVSDEAQILAVRDAVIAEHETEHINLLFNNAGIGGGGSFLLDDRDDWERTFAVCWYGVYYSARAFMPLLVASDEGHIINTSSVNGFWASLGPGVPHTAYSAAKFAVKGFSEALINDLRLNAPHVKVSVVMPGHIGTEIAANTGKVLGHPDPLDMPAEAVAVARRQMSQRGLPVDSLSDDQIRAAIKQRATDFRENAPTTAAQAATIIINGVREDRWRVLVGDDAKALDETVRSYPEDAYEGQFMERIQSQGHLTGIVPPVDNSD